MNTFLPFADFSKSAQALDDKRLGKQRVECLQLHDALTKGGAWANHPCTKMWAGYEDALIKYGLIVCHEWRRRGFGDTVLDKLNERYSFDYKDPPWLGDERLHKSHRQNLIRKDPFYYAMTLGWNDGPSNTYFWPV